MAVGYMDEAGFTLSLPPAYTWVRCRESKRVPRVRGKGGRLNVLGHLVWDGEKWRLWYALCRGKVGGAEVRAYLDRVMEGLGRPLRLFLDHASFHRGKEVKGRVGYWEERGLELGYLPRYRPHLNPMETVWRRVKGFLLPRRYYRDLDELEEAVRLALRALGGVEVVF